MSKLIDKLARLHSSRVNAQNAGNYVAEPETQTVQTDQVDEANPENNNHFDALRRSSALKEKSRRKSTNVQKKSEERSNSGTQAPLSPNTTHKTPFKADNNAVGGRLQLLRVQAQALIDVNASESALPMLFEMVAIAPTNPFPLQHLVHHYENIGEKTLATLYRDRLKQVAPY